MAAGLQAPLIDLPLIASDAGSDPGRAREDIHDFRAQEIKNGTARRHGVGNPHDELDVRRILKQTLLHKIRRVVEHCKIEYFDLRLDAIFEHRSRQAFDKVGWIFVDSGGEVYRAGGE